MIAGGAVADSWENRFDLNKVSCYLKGSIGDLSLDVALKVEPLNSASSLLLSGWSSLNPKP